MAELRRRFSIDNGLGRYTKALRYLCESDDFEELKSYTSQHQLYSESLYLYRYQAEKLNDVMRMYADHLVARSKFREGALGTFIPFSNCRPLLTIRKDTSLSLRSQKL